MTPASIHDPEAQGSPDAPTFSARGERAVATWDAIWRRCFHFEGPDGAPVPYFSVRRLQGYRDELAACGAIMHLRRHGRPPVIIGWPSRCVAWLQLKIERGEL